MSENNKINVLAYLERENFWLKLLFDDEHIKDKCSIYSARNPQEFIEKLDSAKFKVVVFCFPEFNFSKHKQKYLEVLVKAAKSKGVKYVVGIDLIIFAGQYISAGADYFFQKGDVVHRNIQKKKYSVFDLFKHLLDNIILNKKPNQSIESLIIEKKEFYDSVKDIFDYRSTITANTRMEIGIVKRALDKYGAGVVLDGGCGKGRLSEPLASLGFKVTGVDINDGPLEEAKSKRASEYNPEYYKMSLTDLDFPSGRFQAVILMWHVINEFKEYQSRVLMQAHKVLCSKGILIFDFPDIGSNINIDEEGTYEDEGTGLVKYRGLVLPVDRMLRLVESQGFFIVDYKRVEWGGGKFFVTAIKV